MQRYADGTPIKEYAIAAIATASPPKLLALTNGYGRARVELESKDGKTIVKFGDNTVQADKTVTAEALADGNFSVPAGAIQRYDIDETSQKYVSVIADDVSSTLIIRVLGLLG